jgi:O-6-methylguanine DNA methyltransferase
MRAELTRYAVESWGAGELWTADGVVLAHDFDFRVSGDEARIAPESRRARGDAAGPGAPMGAPRPPSGTVAAASTRMGDGLVADLSQLPTRPRLGAGVDPEKLVARLTAFLAGDDVSFDDVPLDLSSWTPFQRAAAAALRGIPRGEIVTYGELAALAGHPGAQRAAGTFCARNRFMLLVPCHRVVGADGIGSYGSAGVSVKRRLLALEGVSL